MGEDVMTASTFAFTKLVVSDLASSERFYGQVFGMLPFERVPADEHASALEEIMLTSNGEPDIINILIHTRYLHRPCPAPGAAWVGFTVNDLDGTIDAAVRFGGKVAVAAQRMKRTMFEPQYSRIMKGT
jgi:predicted enzyme related to lactoylglutathione lyase